MSQRSRTVAAGLAGLIGILAVALVASAAGAGSRKHGTNVEGTIWVANRSTHMIRGFDAATGAVVNTVDMQFGSQPGDLAYARGKLYVAEEFGSPPGIVVVDAETGVILRRIPTGTGSRPHHAHASPGGGLVAFGLYGTDAVAVVDTRTDTLLGPWDINKETANGRVHAGVFSTDGRTLYVASDASHEVVALEPRTGVVLWRMTAPGAHELAVAPNGRTAYLSRRTANMLSVVDLTTHTYRDVLPLGLPDTLRLARKGKLLTVGLRTTPAQIAVVDTRTFAAELVNIGPALELTIAGHQWTSPDGRTTFAAFEAEKSPGVAVIDHRAGNRVVQTLSYPGRPHGVDRAPASDDDNDDESEETQDDD